MNPDSSHITMRNYAKPHRAFLVRCFNGIGWVLRFFGFGRKLKSVRLMMAAGRKTGLSDFGVDFLPEAFEKLLASINDDAFLNPFGRMVSRIRLRGVLENRLRAQYWFAKHPEILQLELPPIYVITGLQRTGTTMLHRLLAADPDTRSLSSWEAINPAPVPGLDSDTDRQKRIDKALQSQNVLAYLAPDFFAVHPVEAHAPEEDCLLLDAAFLSTVPEATLRVPAYSAWLEGVDQTPAYEYMKKLLQLLQWQRPAKRWILKTPHHMEYLETLTAVFPEVQFIQTHREPHTTIPSFCSMIAHGRGVFSNRIDPAEIGRDWGRKVHRMVERTLRYRSGAEGDRFHDVYYRDLMADPVEEVRKIYRRFDLPWSDELNGIMTDTNKRNYQNRYGIHSYDPGDFGLTAEGIRGDFAEYYQRFFPELVQEEHIIAKKRA